MTGASSFDDRAVVNGATNVSAVPASVPSAGDLKVWWVPQVPCKAFEVAVPDLQTALIITNVLGAYDAFQFENNIKPDYCNAGGLVMFEDGEWVDWWDDDACMDFDEVRLFPETYAQTIEARRAETQSGSVHESAATEGEAPDA